MISAVYPHNNHNVFIMACLSNAEVFHSTESQFPAVLPDPSSSLDVTEMELKATLCRSDKHDYKPCLLIDLTLQGICHL